MLMKTEHLQFSVKVLVESLVRLSVSMMRTWNHQGQCGENYVSMHLVDLI